MRLIAALFLLPFLALADTAYYVDYQWTGTSSGTAAHPWTAFNDANVSWSTISNDLKTADVRVYFSARTTKSGVDWTPHATGPHWLYLIGDEQFNTNTSGTAVWATETTGSRATLKGGGFSLDSTWTGYSNLVCKGLVVQSNGYTAFNFSFADGCGSSPPFVGCKSTNIHGIHVTNCAAYWINGPGGYSLFWGNNTTNCYDYVMSGCQVSNVTQGVYFGRYSYLDDLQTNCVCESNIFWNCCRAITGPAGDSGVINIKPGAYGCVVQYNLIGRDSGVGGGGNGIFDLADHTIIRANTIQNQVKLTGSYGNAIFLSCGGDAQGTPKNITGGDIYNNLLTGCENEGIFLDASDTGINMSGVRIYNNTIVSNTVAGIAANSGGAISNNVVAIENNILNNNGGTGQELILASKTVVATLDYNLVFRSDGAAPFNVNSVNKTWAQWQSLGNDAHGVNSDPLLTPFALQGGSPALNAGTTIGLFSTDILGVSRPQGSAWDIGAYESTAVNGVFLNGVTLNGVTIK